MTYREACLWTAWNLQENRRFCLYQPQLDYPDIYSPTMFDLDNENCEKLSQVFATLAEVEEILNYD